MKNNNLKLNFIYQIAYQILILGVPLIVSPYLTRVLGAEALGSYSYSYSIASIFVMFGMLGIQNHGCRMIAGCNSREEEKKTFYGLFYTHLFFSLIFTILYFIFVVLFLRDYLMVGLLVGLYVSSSIFDVTWYYYGVEKFKGVIFKNVTLKIAEIVLILTLVRGVDDLLIYAAIVCGSILIGNLILWPHIIKSVGFSKPVLSDIKPHLKPLLLLSISVIAVNVYTMLDKAILGAFSGASKESVAFYDYSEKIVKIPITILVTLNTVLLPKMSFLAKNQLFSEMKDKVYKANMLLSCLSSGACFGLVAVSEILVPAFYGLDFISCVEYIIYLSPLIIIIPFGATVRSSFLLPLHRDKDYVVSLVVAASVNLILDLALVPFYGVYGAIIGTISAEFMALLLQYWYVRKDLPVWKYVLNLVPFLFFAFTMFLGIRFMARHLPIDNDWMLLLICCSSGLIFYLLLSLLYFLILKTIVKKHV